MILSYNEFKKELKDLIGAHITVGGRESQKGYVDLFELEFENGDYFLRSLYDGFIIQFSEAIEWNCDDKYYITDCGIEYTLYIF